jgi:integrase
VDQELGHARALRADSAQHMAAGNAHRICMGSSSQARRPQSVHHGQRHHPAETAIAREDAPQRRTANDPTAASAITDTRNPHDAAKRWVPWLLAYSGARPGEITQLRRSDVVQQDGVHGLRITPEAGTVKGGAARVVPLHEHLLSQGFLDFVASKQNGPLFHRPARDRETDDAMKQKKPRYAQARQRLAAWVREIGVDDPHLSPNHAWRHTFKQIAERHGISERMSDQITGHAPTTTGREYGRATLQDMAEALKRFPPYSV